MTSSSSVGTRHAKVTRSPSSASVTSSVTTSTPLTSAVASLTSPVVSPPGPTVSSAVHISIAEPLSSSDSSKEMTSQFEGDTIETDFATKTNSIAEKFSKQVITLHRKSTHIYPLTLWGHWSITDDFTTNPFYLVLSSGAHVVQAKSISVHSLILSFHLFSLPILLFPFSVQLLNHFITKCSLGNKNLFKVRWE